MRQQLYVETKYCHNPFIGKWLGFYCHNVYYRIGRHVYCRIFLVGAVMRESSKDQNPIPLIRLQTKKLFIIRCMLY